MFECSWLPFRLAAVLLLAEPEFILIFFVPWATLCFSTFISAIAVYKWCDNIWRNKLEHHENVDFQRLQEAVCIYQQSDQVTQTCGFDPTIIAFLAGLFLLPNAYFYFFFFRKKRRVGWVNTLKRFFDIHIFIQRL